MLLYKGCSLLVLVLAFVVWNGMEYRTIYHHFSEEIKKGNERSVNSTVQYSMI